MPEQLEYIVLASSEADRLTQLINEHAREGWAIMPGLALGYGNLSSMRYGVLMARPIRAES